MTRDFRLLAAGQTLSWVGNGFQTIALAVAIVRAGGGPGVLGLVMATSVLAMVAGSLFGGVWADRLQPQRVMVVSDLVRLLAAGGLALMFTGRGYHLSLLCLLAAASSGAGSFFNPAMSALKPLLVPVESRQQANATLGLLRNGSSIAGPALGGVLVAAFGAPAGFTVNAASFLASMAAALLLRVRTERGPRTSMWREMGAGWREISRRDWLLGGLAGAAVYHVANGVILVLVQVIAIQRLGGAAAAGFIAAAEGFGGLLGAALGLRLRPRRLLRAGWLTLLLMPIWALAYVWPATLVAVMAGAVIGYAGLFFYDVSWETAIQDRVPHRALGRVVSWDYLTSFIAMPLGNALAGPLSRAYGINPVLVGCAVVLGLVALSQQLIPGVRTLTRATTPEPVPAQPIDRGPPMAAQTQLHRPGDAEAVVEQGGVGSVPADEPLIRAAVEGCPAR